jgi:hypothetical protein
MVSSTTTSTGSFASAPIENTGAAPYPWIISKNFDFFFVCGGAVWILLAINYLFLGWTVPVSSTIGDPLARFLMIVILIGQHVSADSHNAATYLRIYGSQEDRSRFHFYGKWLALSCIPVFFMGINVPSLAGAFVLIYLLTVFWHYAAQTFGVSLIYCYKQGYFLKSKEKEIYRGFILSMSALILVRLMTFQELSPKNFFGVELPFWGPLPLWFYHGCLVVFIGFTVAFSVVLLKNLVVEKKMMPWPALLCISTIALIGFSYGTLSTMVWFYIPVFFHGTQYLAVCLSYYLKERGLPEHTAPSQMSQLVMSPTGLQYLGLVILIGAFLYVAIPHICQSIGYDYALVAGVVLATVNYHHFITDAAIWRLRDPRCRQILLA